MKQKWQMQSSAQNSDWKYADRQKKKNVKNSLALKENNMLNKTGKSFI